MKPKTYFFEITLRDGQVLYWGSMTKQKAASMFKWTFDRLESLVLGYEWGEEKETKPCDKSHITKEK